MANLRRFCCDDETGEIIPYDINEETGEQLLLKNTLPVNTLSRVKYRSAIKFPRGYVSKTRKFQVLKANILTGCNTTSHRMLLFIPTITIFPSIVCIMLILFEMYLHVRCHKKNKKLEDENVYYRSPFHVVTSTFCGVCRDSNMAMRIKHLQDKRRYRYDYLRGIAI